MAQQDPAEQVKYPKPGEDREAEHERVRSSNDRDQALERDGDASKHNRGYDAAVDDTAPVEPE